MDEKEYYKRQMILSMVGASGQEKLKKSKLLIVGAGGLGHPAATYLASSGVGEISIIDHDMVEASNLNRQIIFTPEDIGKSKAKILESSLKRQNPFIEVNAKQIKIDSSNALDLCDDFDVILDCCDNFPTKFLLHDCAWLLKKDLVQASLYQYEGQIQTFQYSKATDRGCLRCLWPDTPSNSCVQNCAQAGVLGAVAGTLGSMQAMEGIKCILEIGDISQCSTVIIDLLNMEFSKNSWKKNSSCPLCSENSSIKEIKQSNYFSYEDFEIDSIDSENFELVDI